MKACLKESLLRSLWSQIYPGIATKLLDEFIGELKTYVSKSQSTENDPLWYKDAVVYSLYVDLFNKDFKGLENKLDDLMNLGVNCLWLLPILDSPMKDAGFDIRRYDRVRFDLLGLAETSSDEERQASFRGFLTKAKERGIRVIFDIAINHTSDQHEWFQSARQGEDAPYRDYYIWNKDEKKYADCRIIFKGLCPSNWEKDGDSYFFHRFFEFQPDLNYRNPEVLLMMSRNFLYWMSQGVDGFRADAIPYLWKEEGTNCENLPMTHTVIKFFRAVFDSVRPGTLLLAEACQPPQEVVKYFGQNDECHAGYHFPLMPQIFKSLATSQRDAILDILRSEVTPKIEESSQWFMFLRCHDELTLEMVTEADRKLLHDAYCLNPKWDFRVGEGISARLSELMQRDHRRVALAYSIMLTLPGTPIIYYGDEFGKMNDESYFDKMKVMTGKNDTRYFVRGRLDWGQIENDLADSQSFVSLVHKSLKLQLNSRNKTAVFGRGTLKWIDAVDEKGNAKSSVLAYVRAYKNERIVVINNLSADQVRVKFPTLEPLRGGHDILGQLFNVDKEGFVTLSAYGYYWY